MAPPAFLCLLPSSRPPALGSRRRLIAPKVERALRGWIHDELRASTGKLVELSEWVSLDSRAIPHTVSILVEAGGAHRHVVIERASERILATDVRAAMATIS